MKNYLQINKTSWNAEVDTHLQSDFYFVYEFLKDRTSLNSIELELLGDIKGNQSFTCSAISDRILFHCREWGASHRN
jgi:hypothetical protein